MAEMKPYLNGSNRMITMPLIDTLVFYLFMDHLKVSDVVWGVFWTLMSFLWLIYIIQLLTVFVGRRKKFTVTQDGKIIVD